MANESAVTHADGTTFSDGAGYAPSPKEINEARHSGLAKTIRRPTARKQLNRQSPAPRGGLFFSKASA